MSVARIITSPLIQPFFCGEAPTETASSKKVTKVAINAMEQKGIRNALGPIFRICLFALSAVVVLSALVIALSIIFSHPLTALIIGVAALVLLSAIVYFFPSLMW
jgi:hypothetical protein